MQLRIWLLIDASGVRKQRVEVMVNIVTLFFFFLIHFSSIIELELWDVFGRLNGGERD